MRQAGYSLGGFTPTEARLMLTIMDAVVPIAETEVLSWKARAEQNYAEWEAANKLLEQTIEVLKALQVHDWWFVPSDIQYWYFNKAKPLLDNLKERKP